MGFASINGINSGLNTTEIVDSIIRLERLPAVLLEQEQAEKTNIVSSLKTLQAKLLALSSQTGRLTRRANFEKASVSVSDDAYLSASSAGRVVTGSYDVQVRALARNHQLASQGFSDDAAGILGTGTLTVTVGDGSPRTLTIDNSNNSLTGVRDAINNADLGVRASIINDGTESNPYRLILSSEESGRSSQFTVTSTLTGGESLNYSTGSFDLPETLVDASASTSQISLGPTAAYTGLTNKTYTFTVASDGQQTIGVDPVTVDWTDGTNSGSFVVIQADQEIELVGEGADGLKLSFSAGDLVAGDSFQVTAFGPLLQQAQDATIAVGGSGSGSAIEITSESNTFSQALAGLSLNVSKVTDPGQTITVSSEVDTSAITETIQGFLDAYNDVMSFVDDQNSFNPDTNEGGLLLGDTTLFTIQSGLRNRIAQNVAGLDSKYRQLNAIGIRSGVNGQLSIRDSSRLEEALRTDLDAVIDLFVDSGASSSNAISFVASTADTSLFGEDVEVDITQAAERGRFEGISINDPSSQPLTLTDTNNRLKIKVDGALSDEIILSAQTYSTVEQLISELQAKIDADSKIGNRGVSVGWVETSAGTGYIEFNSASYGSSSGVEMDRSIGDSAFGALGLAGGRVVLGKDVEGTINGEAATGSGQLLTADEDNATTAGLQLRIELTVADLTDGADGTITLARGVAARVDTLLESYTDSTIGLLNSRITAVQNQIETIEERVEDIDSRLALRRDTLLQQFFAMEEALGALNADQQFLTNQLASINQNWRFNQ